jgi:hypothetical protein
MLSVPSWTGAGFNIGRFNNGTTQHTCSFREQSSHGLSHNVNKKEKLKRVFLAYRVSSVVYQYRYTTQ